jgi:benzoyl-CoA reductase/2-hydroxyglutaryl-CoA dehydratase subunit BcrC/BadD/HgdB
MKPGLERFTAYKNIFTGGIQQLQAAPEPDEVQIAFLKLTLKHVEFIIDAIENDRPLISGWYGNACEVYAAMNLAHFCPVDLIIATQPLFDTVDRMHEGDTPSDSCGLIQLAIDGVRRGIVPIPSVICCMLEPCDAQSLMHEAWETVDGWENIPTIALDPPYGNTDEDFTYYAGELKREIAFLEEHTGAKMDWGELKRVCEETNKLYTTWDELNQCLMQKPCPMHSLEAAEYGWGASLHINWPGDPEATAFFELMRDTAAKRVRQGIGAIPDERIRILWADLNGSWAQGLIGPWLEETYGAVMVNSFAGRTPYTPVDTSNVDSMLFGLARRGINEVPMIRQARGSVDIFLEDINTMCSDYQVDCVFFPGHKGHKDQGGNIGYLREACRAIEMPLLTFTADIFDPSYLPIDQLKHSIAEFFDAQGWKPLQ